MNPQDDLFERAYDLLVIELQSLAVLRRMQAKYPRGDGLYAWIRNACFASFDAESEALADQYRDVIDAPETDEMKANQSCGLSRINR